MKILGIETSCDETAAAIVENGTKILSNVVASSQELQAKFGGIIPDRAAREQLKSMIPVISEALVTDVDAIAVTSGPGLVGSLLIGVETAKTLALALNKPLVPVNHVMGHIYGNWLESEPPKFPAVVLIVSGGHSELVLMKGHGKFEFIGGTRDDAAGECFDKCARLLNLGYPGGPAIEAAASKYEIRISKFETRLPRPMINEKNYDFSFSGLKTAVKREFEKGNLEASALAYELQEAVVDVLVTKTIKAAREFKVQSVLIAGGVSANKRLREKFGEWSSEFGVKIPPLKYCTDNAAWIASCAYFNYNPKNWKEIQADPSYESF